MISPLLASLPTIFACATCIGNPNERTTIAANAAIIFMLVVLVLVLGSLCGLIAFLRRCEKRAASLEDN